VEIYDSAHFVPLLWGAVIVAAPVFEEIFFRGFLLEGLRRSRLGSGGAVVLTALSWAALHIQNGSYEISLIFSLGLALGWVRLRTHSLYPALAMHALVNLVDILQMAGYWFY
jgi:membrane protease YdiL (CAAX protease family)